MFVDELAGLLGKRASTVQSVREQHSHGESWHPPGLPDVVCYPRATSEVSEILKISARYGVPVVPFGAGSSIEGQVHAIRGGISIDLTRMNAILRVSAEDLHATVEAGVTRKQLNAKINPGGLAFFVDPGADATMGGMA